MRPEMRIHPIVPIGDDPRPINADILGENLLMLARQLILNPVPFGRTAQLAVSARSPFLGRRSAATEGHGGRILGWHGAIKT